MQFKIKARYVYVHLLTLITKTNLISIQQFTNAKHIATFNLKFQFTSSKKGKLNKYFKNKNKIKLNKKLKTSIFKKGTRFLKLVLVLTWHDMPIQNKDW